MPAEQHDESDGGLERGELISHALSLPRAEGKESVVSGDLQHTRVRKSHGEAGENDVQDYEPGKHDCEDEQLIEMRISVIAMLIDMIVILLDMIVLMNMIAVLMDMVVMMNMIAWHSPPMGTALCGGSGRNLSIPSPLG